LGDVVVDRICLDGRRATGVIARTSDGLREFQARETIIAGGAVHSPGVLIRSGIGPAAGLREIGVEVVADLPVGENLSDHSAVALGIRIRPEFRVSTVEHRHTNCCLRYSSGMEGTGLNDMFMAATNLSGYDDSALERGAIVVWTNQVFSKGTVRLSSLDPGVDPDIEINMLSDERDTVRLRDGYRRLLQIVRHPAADAVSEGLVAPLSETFPEGSAPDDVIDQWLLENCADTQHPVGTCRMGPAYDPRSVVDPECRVIGFEGLRVIDASIMPENVRANTHLSTVAIGEHMAARLAR
jgi:choline dehydrogenase